MQVARGNLHVLDFQRIKDAEREAAKALFLTPPPTSQPTALAVALLAPPTASTIAALAAKKTNGAGAGGRMMTAEEREKVKRAVMKAENVDEVRRLERMLREGWMPDEEKDKVDKAAAEEGKAAPVAGEEVEEETTESA